MMTTSAASMIVNALSGQQGARALPGDDLAGSEQQLLPEHEPVKQHPAQRLLNAAAATIWLWVPNVVKSHLKARAEARHLDLHLRRLDELSPHLLMDIGVAELVSDEFAMENSRQAEQPREAVREPKAAVRQRAKTTQPAVGPDGLSAAFG